MAFEDSEPRLRLFLLLLAFLPPCPALSAEKADEPPAMTLVRPERSWEQVQAAAAETPPVTYQPPADRWDCLPITRERLAGEGGSLSIVRLGDSVINDTWRSRWVDRVGAAVPRGHYGGDEARRERARDRRGELLAESHHRRRGSAR